MRTTAIVAAGILVLSIASSRAQQPTLGPQATAIRAVADAYVKASLAADVKGIVALYTEDAIEMPPNEPAVKGRAAIEQYYQKQFAGGTKLTTFKLTHIESRALSDAGYDIGTYEQSLTTKGSAAPIKDTGKYIVILKRAGGAWKVSHAIYNSDLPPQPQR